MAWLGEVEEGFDEECDGFVEFAVGAGAWGDDYGEAPFAVEDVGFGHFGAGAGADFFAVLDADDFGDFDASVLDVFFEGGDDFFELVGYVGGRFFGFGFGAGVEDGADVGDYVVADIGLGLGLGGCGLRRGWLGGLGGWLVERVGEVEEVVGVVGVDEGAEVDFVGGGVEVGEGVHADEAGAGDVAGFEVDDLVDGVLFGELLGKEFVEEGEDGGFVASFLETEHDFEAVLAWGCEGEEDAGVLVELEAELVEVDFFFGEVVEVEDEVFGVGEVFGFAEVRVEHAANDVGEVAFEEGVLFGVDVADDAELPDEGGCFVFWGEDGVEDGFDGDFLERVAGECDMVAERNHLSMFLNCWASF